ncbi:MAG: LPS export ABC transporter permease LptF [Deltaproteobacteria bacterium]|nr:LPS export ABC transporter permease LptF [Deltaproteobacteria bacterium]
MNTIINRYIMKEISVPFFMILFIFTFVLLMGRILQLMDLMINKGVGFSYVMSLILYLIPSFLIITIPIALLISILIGLGRLSSDHEITIFKSSGISLYQMLLPIGIASLAAFIVTALTGFFLVPYGNFATKNLLMNIAKQKANIGIKEKVFNDNFKNMILYAENIPVHGNFMEGVFIFDNSIDKQPTTIIAQKGYLVSSSESASVTLRLQNGSTHTVDPAMKTYKKMDFSSYDITLDLSSSMTGSDGTLSKDSKEMSLFELAGEIKEASAEKAAIREILIEFNKKFTIPLSCIVFGLLAIPFGVARNVSGKSRGFVTGIFLVMSYYVLQLSGEALGETGRISPILGAWAPNIILGSLGVYLLIMAGQEKPLYLHLRMVSTCVRKTLFQNTHIKKLPARHSITELYNRSTMARLIKSLPKGKFIIAVTKKKMLNLYKEAKIRWGK